MAASIAKKEKDSFIFIDHTCTGYTFKRNKAVEKGQYRLPFILKLPQKLPGTFNLTKKSSTGEHPENL